MTTTQSQLDKLVSATNIIDRVANGTYGEVVPTEQGNVITVLKAITDLTALSLTGLKGDWLDKEVDGVKFVESFFSIQATKKPSQSNISGQTCMKPSSVTTFSASLKMFSKL